MFTVGKDGWIYQRDTWEVGCCVGGLDGCAVGTRVGCDVGCRDGCRLG